MRYNEGIKSDGGMEMVEFEDMRGIAGESFNGVSIDIECPISILTGRQCYAGYFTRISISPWDYRKDNPTKASCKMTKLSTKTQFEISSDWGDVYFIRIDNDDPVLQKTIDYYTSEHLL